MAWRNSEENYDKIKLVSVKLPVSVRQIVLPILLNGFELIWYQDYPVNYVTRI